MVVVVLVLIGVYLSESATNQLRGIGRSPQLISLTSWNEGMLRIRILGKEWLVDPSAIRVTASTMIVQVRQVIRQQIAAIMAR